MEGLFDGGLHRRGVESERARSAFVGHTASAVDHVQAVGPARIRDFRRVIETVEKRGDLDMKIPDTSFCHVGALVNGFRRGKNNILANIRLHLPHVAGMRLLNVDDVKSHAILVLLIEFVERGNLPAKWRSSIAPEDENHRTDAPEGCETHFRFVIERI